MSTDVTGLALGRLAAERDAYRARVVALGRCVAKKVKESP